MRIAIRLKAAFPAVLVVAVLSLSGLVSASAASAALECQGCAPWWHLTSGSRPSNLQPGSARDEVQEIRTTAEFGIGVLEIGGRFQSPPDILFPTTTAAEVQTMLESAYGTADVEVSGGPVGTSPLVVKSIGALGDQEVEKIEALGEHISVSVPTQGRPDGQIVVTAANLGDASTTGEVSIADELPQDMEAVAIEGIGGDVGLNKAGPVTCEVATLTCKFRGSLPPYAQIEVDIGVVVKQGASLGEANEVSVSGGEARSVQIKRPIIGSPTGTTFGVEQYELMPEEIGGAPDAQAGSHPFQLTTTLALKQTAEANPVAPAKDLHFRLPAGLIGNPTPFPRCTLAQFDIIGPAGLNECPAQTAVGVAMITTNGQTSTFREKGAYTFTVPIFNVEPQVGEPARFGFLLPRAPVFLDTSVRTGGDYGVTVSVPNITQEAAFIKNEVIFWGVPGDPRHDGQRGWSCLAHARNISFPTPCNASEAVHPPPLLALPTSCAGGPLETTVEADSWLEPKPVGQGLSFSSTEPMPTLDGCNRLPFSSEVRVSPDGQAASTPSGLKVDVHVPQEEALNPEGLAPSDVKNITVALPEGLDLNAAAADGLEACSQEQVSLASDTEAACPNASKIATVTIHSPLLPNPLTGFVYLAAPQNFVGLAQNPFSSLVAMYLVAKDPVSGVLVKLAGRVNLGSMGQIVATFENNPQLPFEDAALEFFGGERAPLATPARCGTYTTRASFAPWSGEEAVGSQSHFEITSGPNGSSCPGSSLSFSPSLASGTTNNNAGAFSDLTTTLSREDGQQSIQSVTLHYPAGVSGLLSGVKLCPEAQANTGTCGPESEIGETIVSVGLGGDPFTVTGGKVYITEKYESSPFGLSIVNPAKAGPFDLQQGRPVVVRAKVDVDPHTAALTITTDASGAHGIPTIIEGFPLQIKHVNVLINRPGFTFNPTSCTPMAVTGQVNSAEGASLPVSVPFQAANCANLKFPPKFAVSTSGKTSKAMGASLSVKLTYPQAPFGTQANIARVKVDLPKALPSRLTTLQKACTNAQFEANPAGCPAASVIGHAKAVTPLIPVPLEGPAYFVSHGGEAFPSLIMVLQGYGVTLDLVGTTFISKTGITSSTFKTVPDAPVGSFELNLPEGKYSALAANGNLCTSKLTMPTEFLGQNGMKINESTPVSVTGCAKKKALTRAQKLAAALKVCNKKAKSKRGACRATAQKRYGPLAKKKSKGKHKT